MRKCPNCGEPSIQVWKLAIGARPRCASCRNAIGPHWLMSAICACGFAIYMIFLGLFLLSTASPIPAAIIGLLLAFVVNYILALLIPLESKLKWWAP